MRIENVKTIRQALAIFEDIAGMSADEAAELTSAKSKQLPQAVPLAKN